MQEGMLKALSDRLRRWRYRGTWDARKELYELLSAASVALKAQYLKSSEGMEPEAGAQKAAQMAVLSMGPMVSEQEKMAMAKKAASMYMKQDLERKRSMQMLDDAIEMLGPIEKAKPNPLLVNYVEAMKRAIESAKNNYNVNDDGPCTDYAEKALLHISGSPSFADVNGKPNPLLLSTDPD